MQGLPPAHGTGAGAGGCEGLCAVCCFQLSPGGVGLARGVQSLALAHVGLYLEKGSGWQLQAAFVKTSQGVNSASWARHRRTFRPQTALGVHREMIDDGGRRTEYEQSLSSCLAAASFAVQCTPLHAAQGGTGAQVAHTPSQPFHPQYIHEHIPLTPNIACAPHIDAARAPACKTPHRLLILRRLY
jgi:hypothetical protein